MQKNKVSKLLRILKIAVIVYIVCGVLLYFLQEKFLFHPQPLPVAHAYNFKDPFREINLRVSDEKNLNIIQFTLPDSLRKGVILYFHGNRKNIGRYAGYASNFTRNNYEVWMPDYPGFGKSTGKLTEEQLYSDALLVYQMARAKFPKENIIIYGKSLGSGIAAYLASQRDCKRLLLETPYYSIAALMKHYAFLYPVSWMAKYHFPTWQYLKKVEVPVTLFHGTNDEVIPYKQAKRIANENPGIQLITIEKGKHNNLTESRVYQEQLNRILQLP